MTPRTRRIAAAVLCAAAVAVLVIVIHVQRGKVDRGAQESSTSTGEVGTPRKTSANSQHAVCPNDPYQAPDPGREKAGDGDANRHDNPEELARRLVLVREKLDTLVEYKKKHFPDAKGLFGWFTDDAAGRAMDSLSKEYNDLVWSSGELFIAFVRMLLAEGDQDYVLVAVQYLTRTYAGRESIFTRKQMGLLVEMMLATDNELGRYLIAQGIAQHGNDFGLQRKDTGSEAPCVVLTEASANALIEFLTESMAPDTISKCAHFTNISLLAVLGRYHRFYPGVRTFLLQTVADETLTQEMRAVALGKFGTHTPIDDAEVLALAFLVLRDSRYPGLQSVVASHFFTLETGRSANLDAFYSALGETLSRSSDNSVREDIARRMALSNHSTALTWTVGAFSSTDIPWELREEMFRQTRLKAVSGSDYHGGFPAEERVWMYEQLKEMATSSQTEEHVREQAFFSAMTLLVNEKLMRGERDQAAVDCYSDLLSLMKNDKSQVVRDRAAKIEQMLGDYLEKGTPIDFDTGASIDWD
jgi:hypothetical protein